MAGLVEQHEDKRIIETIMKWLASHSEQPGLMWIRSSDPRYKVHYLNKLRGQINYQVTLLPKELPDWEYSCLYLGGKPIVLICLNSIARLDEICESIAVLLEEKSASFNILKHLLRILKESEIKAIMEDTPFEEFEKFWPSIRTGLKLKQPISAGLVYNLFPHKCRLVIKDSGNFLYLLKEIRLLEYVLSQNLIIKPAELISSKYEDLNEEDEQKTLKKEYPLKATVSSAKASQLLEANHCMSEQAMLDNSSIMVQHSKPPSVREVDNPTWLLRLIRETRILTIEAKFMLVVSELTKLVALLSEGSGEVSTMLGNLQLPKQSLVACKMQIYGSQHSPPEMLMLIGQELEYAYAAFTSCNSDLFGDQPSLTRVLQTLRTDWEEWATKKRANSIYNPARTEEFLDLFDFLAKEIAGSEELKREQLSTKAQLVLKLGSEENITYKELLPSDKSSEIISKPLGFTQVKQQGQQVCDSLNKIHLEAHSLLYSPKTSQADLGEGISLLMPTGARGLRAGDYTAPSKYSRRTDGELEPKSAVAGDRIHYYSSVDHPRPLVERAKPHHQPLNFSAMAETKAARTQEYADEESFAHLRISIFPQKTEEVDLSPGLGSYQDLSPSNFSQMTHDEHKVINDKAPPFESLLGYARNVKLILKNLTLKKQENLLILEYLLFYPKIVLKELDGHLSGMISQNAQLLHRFQDILSYFQSEEAHSRQIYYKPKQVMEYLGMVDLLPKEILPRLKQLYNILDDEIVGLVDRFEKDKQLIEYAKSLSKHYRNVVEPRLRIVALRVVYDGLIVGCAEKINLFATQLICRNCG
jgi:hypothetical protein